MEKQVHDHGQTAGEGFPAMEKLVGHDHGEAADEEFSDEFQCCVCLDIMYKPVVLACGHISCFWCVYKAMDNFQGSRCPVCRNQYYHFPRVCELLHFLLLKLYPQAYKRKERQVAEEEKMSQHESPQFDGNFVISQSSKVSDEDNTPNLSATSSSQSSSNEPNSMVEHTNKVLMTDLLCAICKQLLCRPVVLNCGHVYCEACMDAQPQDNVCKCPVCQSAHPKGFPSVCLILEHFLEEHFPGEYSARKASLPPGPSGRSREKHEQAAQSSSQPTDVYSSIFSGNGSKFHPRIGCDYCGMCPIIGVRYKCKDCVEKIGFDLCEGCYNNSSTLPGRFNQRHTKEHQFEVIQPGNLHAAMLRVGGSNEFRIVYISNDEGTDNDRIVYLSNDEGTDNEIETLESPGEDPRDPENASTSPDSLNDHDQ